MLARMDDNRKHRFSGRRTDWDVGIEVDHGWCELRLTASGESVTVRAHTLIDSLGSLFASLVQLARETDSVSVRWAGEIAGGSFIDLVRDPQHHVNIAVHEFKHGVTAETYTTIYSAARGECQFSARVPLGDFIGSFANAGRKLRVTQTDSFGYMEQWGWVFPVAAHDALEQEAARHGHKPIPTQSLTKSS